jgi:hypothetical protein
LIDADGDGWDDLWVLSEIKTKQLDSLRILERPNDDDDGDGFTNREEMLLFRDPLKRDLVPSAQAIARQVEADRVYAAQVEARRAEALKEVLEEGRKTAAQALPANARFAEATPTERAAVLDSAGRSMDAVLQQRAKEARDAMSDPAVRGLLIGASGIGTVVGLAEGRPLLDAPNNRMAADTISTDELWPGGGSPLPDLNGAGRTLGIWEALGGPLTTHQEFVTGGASRILQVDNPTTETGVALYSHATQVAGTLVATGVNNQARGMSFASNLRSYASVGDTGEMAIEAAAGMEVSNHSYSRIAGWVYNSQLPLIGGNPAPPWLWIGPDIVGEDPSFGHYGPTSRQIDLVIYAAKHYLPCWSAGNEVTDFGPTPSTPPNPPVTYWRLSGPTTITTSTTFHPPDGGNPLTGFDTLKQQGVAKNNFVVGAVEGIVGGYSFPSQVLITNFSSSGPTDDGRIKPDVVADGDTFLTSHYEAPTGGAPAVNIYTDGSIPARAAVSGTSFSSPSVASSFNLLQDLHATLDGRPLWASTWRALGIATADDAGFADGGPDYLYGWGLFNTRTAADLLKAHVQSSSLRSLIRQHCLFNGQTIQFVVQCDGTRPLRVTNAWTDPAFQASSPADLSAGLPDTPATADGTASRLINDLDLRVTRPGGAVALPWRLNPASPGAAATRADNFRDNVEQVLINDASGNAPAGLYTVSISHKGTLRVANQLTPTSWELTNTNGRQQFSLVISGIVPRAVDAHVVTLFQKLSSNHVVAWNSVQGSRYQVEKSTDLATWTNVLTPINATSPSTTLTIPVSNPQPNHIFYRVREVGLE